MNVKVYNLKSPRTGKAVANQFVIESSRLGARQQVYQSYDSTIAVIDYGKQPWQITLDVDYWNYSATTLKYLKEFLGISLNKASIKKLIDNDTYKTAKLN